MIIQMIQMSVTSGQTDRHLTSSKILMLYTIGPFGAKMLKRITRQLPASGGAQTPTYNY